jgi:hypothetical protein
MRQSPITAGTLGKTGGRQNHPRAASRTFVSEIIRSGEFICGPFVIQFLRLSTLEKTGTCLAHS